MATSRISFGWLNVAPRAVGCTGLATRTEVYGPGFPCQADRVSAPAVPRCAAHPARLAVDRCPRCARPRCAADADRGGGCAICRSRMARTGRVASRLEAATRAGLAV